MNNTPLDRGPRTLAVGLILVGVYFAYARLTAPWLNVTRPQDRSVLPGSEAHSRSPEFAELSRKWFPGDEWVASAGKKFRDKDRYLFFRTFELFNENKSMQVKPVAMLWKRDEDDQPVTLTADSAQLERSAAFSATETELSSFGRIVGGVLFGSVRIRGPHGLRIDGNSFNISEDSMKIWSSQPVTFAWEQHTGRAEGGVEIHLLASANGQDGLMSISDIHSIRLNGRVICDLLLEDGKPGTLATPLRINAARGFTYLVQTRTATFFGFDDHRTPRPENQILLQRMLADGPPDQLFCTQLTLQMRPAIRSPGDSGSQSGQMELQSILAEGSRVVVRSEANDLTAIMTSLRYTIDERRLDMWNNKTDTSGRPFPVTLRQGGSEVLTPHVVGIHNDQNQIQIVECSGPGLIRHLDKSDPDSIEASWNKSFVFRQQPDRKVILDGTPSVRQAARKLKLSGEQIELTLASDESEAGDSGSGNVAEIGNSASGRPASAELGRGIDFSHLSPEQLIARKNVQLEAVQLSGTARELLVVNFHKHNPADAASAIRPVSLTPTAATAGSAKAPTAGSGLSDSDTESSAFTHFEAEILEASVLSSDRTSTAGESKKTDDAARFSELWLKGKVTVDHTAADPEESFHAEGNVLSAENGFHTGRAISLFGDPATVVSTTRRIEGQRIDLKELKNEVVVEGGGRIRIVVDRGFDGKPLPAPSPLDIYWGDRMFVRERTAHFVGSVRAVMKESRVHDLELTCAGMKVHFTNELRLQRNGKDHTGREKLAVAADVPSGAATTNGTEIERIECESLVNVRIDQMLDGLIEAQHSARFSDLVVNLKTGDFSATGPGWLESTQPDRGNRLRVSPGVTAQANTPVRVSENPFVYSRASFIGTMTGNLNTEVVRLHQHVAGVFGPVRKLGTRIDLDSVSTSEMPPQAGVVRCEQLTVAAIPGGRSDERSFSLLAETKARLESRQFSGNADKITYDHAKQQFILRADAGQTATVFHRPGNSNEVRTLVGQQFEYYPPRNQLKASQILGVRAAQ